MTESPFKPGNASIYCRATNWDVACARTQMNEGVELTAAQKAMFARMRAEKTKQADIEEYLG